MQNNLRVVSISLKAYQFAFKGNTRWVKNMSKIKDLDKSCFLMQTSSYLRKKKLSKVMRFIDFNYVLKGAAILNI